MLPPIIPFHGDWSKYTEELYTFYINEIVNGGLIYDGLPVRFRYNPPTKKKGFGFWHIIQEGALEDERIPDLRRCERISWIPFIIREAGRHNGISIWEEMRGTEIDVLLWLEENNYLVVLAKRHRYLLLQTAYCTKTHKVKT